MIDILNAGSASVYQDDNIAGYFKVPPFSPSENYPEYVFKGKLSRKTNATYEAVRNALILLELDKENIGTPKWNPLKDIVHPGNKVVIKPNFVLDRHSGGGNIECIITQPDVIRAVCDYVYIALQGKGEIVIADAPQADCNFNNLLDITNIEKISEFYKNEVGFNIPVYDLRQLKVGNWLDLSTRIEDDGDPAGYAIVNLGNKSSFEYLSNIDKIYGADYDRQFIVCHHSENTHEYYISKTILNADVIVSMPKMKVHRKAGVTLNLKNLVGINGNKNYLPHFRIGLPQDGGDEFPQLNKTQKMVMYGNRKLEDKLLAKSSRLKMCVYNILRNFYILLCKFIPGINTFNVIRRGDWFGNDTIWRTILDLNKIMLYANKEGNVQDEPQRSFFSVIDGIIAGENEGPLTPAAKKCGVIACGFNPLVVDAAAARIMGFDIEKIPVIKKGFTLGRYKITALKPDDITIKSNIKIYAGALNDNTSRFLHFIPPRGWIGHIEYGK